MYYFLDIDGVLNKESDWRKPFTLNDSCVSCFAEIIKKDSSPHIILSSTWRAGYTNKGEKTSDDQFSKLSEYGITIEGTTPISSKTRQEEIEYYIRKNSVKDYVILDDDESLFPWPERINLYLTDYKTGLTGKDARTIIRKYLK